MPVPADPGDLHPPGVDDEELAQVGAGGVDDLVAGYACGPGHGGDLALVGVAEAAEERDPRDAQVVLVRQRQLGPSFGVHVAPPSPQYPLRPRNIPTGGMVVGATKGVPMAGYSADKEAYLKRLARIEGQVRGIARMVDEDVYCIDILTQVSAVTKALQAVSLGLLEDHVGHCVVDAARESDEAAQAKVREASDAIARLVRS